MKKAKMWNNVLMLYEIRSHTRRHTYIHMLSCTHICASINVLWMSEAVALAHILHSLEQRKTQTIKTIVNRLNSNLTLYIIRLHSNLCENVWKCVRMRDAGKRWKKIPQLIKTKKVPYTYLPYKAKHNHVRTHRLALYVCSSAVEK